MNKRRISIFAGSKLTSPKEYNILVYECIDKLCKLGTYNFAYGGGYTGIMASIKDACITNEADCIGINCTRWKTDHDLQLTKVEYYDTIVERQNRLIEIGDCFLVCPGGIGTLFEALQVITLNDIGEQNIKRPIVFLNVNSYYDYIKEWIIQAEQNGCISKKQDELKYYFVNTIEECISLFHSFN